MLSPGCRLSNGRYPQVVLAEFLNLKLGPFDRTDVRSITSIQSLLETSYNKACQGQKLGIFCYSVYNYEFKIIDNF